MKRENRRMEFRIAFVVCVFAFLFGVVFLRAFELQVVEGKTLKEKARRQHEMVLTVPSKRGRILDRNGRELAISMEVDSVYARPREVSDEGSTARVLSRILSADAGEIRRKLSSDKPFVWLKRQVELDERQRDVVKGLSGLGLIKEPRRFYPDRSLGANVSGFVGVDSNGLEGVELFYDSYLKGSTVKLRTERDARGRALLFKDIEDSASGMDVYLSIDKNIQHIVEKALRKAVSDTGAKGGISIVMDPFTGEVLAMATVPNFDPNDVGRFSPSQWKNRAVTDGFEPGSIIKPIMLAAAIEDGVTSLDELFYCENGAYRVKDRVFHDMKKHAYLTARGVIEHSSNIGAVKIGEKLGKRRAYQHLKAFGFGEKTGVDLPGETDGVLADYSRWSGVTLPTISFGQGFSASPLQVVAAYSAIANQGFLVRPRVVKYIKTPEGKVVEEGAPVVLRRVVSRSVAGDVTEALVAVTEEGTGRLASFEPEVKVAGKTGTAQKAASNGAGYARGKYVMSFVGFAPANNPYVTIGVFLDEPDGKYSGGSVAAPVFSIIARETLSYMGALPGVKGGVKSHPPATVEDNLTVAEKTAADTPHLIPDFSGKTMREVIKAAREKNLDVEVRGSGVAVSQSPLAGTSIGGDKSIVVVFR